MSFLVAVLRFFGFKFATVSQALAAPFGRYACLTFDSATSDLNDDVLPVLQKRGVPATAFVSTRGSSALRHLPALKAGGWEIGTLGHGLVDLTTHGYLEQRRLIARSKTLIQSKLGLQPTVFAYPFGAYDATTVSCVKDEGFAAAVTLRAGLNDETSEAHHLRRLPLVGSLGTDLLKIARTLLGTRTKRAPSNTPARHSDHDSVRHGIAL